MTKGLRSVFDLPPLDGILDDEPENEPENEPEIIVSPQTGDKDLVSVAIDKIDKHGKAMDLIYNDTLKHAIDAAELAFDLDPARAPRMLEVSAIHYKTAIDAQNSKVDATLKMMKLINDAKKIDLDRQKMEHEMGNMPSDTADVIMVEDRNTLLRRLREEALGKKSN